MDVILLQEVEKLGKEGTIANVKAGYARNYLIPRGMAVRATAQHVKSFEERAKQQQAKHDRAKKQAEELKTKLEKLKLNLKLAVGEDNQTFGSVTAHDIAEALAAQKLPVEKSAIHLAEPIKTLGIAEVPVRLHAQVTATLKVWVVKA